MPCWHLKTLKTRRTWPGCQTKGRSVRRYSPKTDHSLESKSEDSKYCTWKVSFWNKYCQWFTTTKSREQDQIKNHLEQDTVTDFTEERAAHLSRHPSPGCMQVSPLQAEKTKRAGWEIYLFIYLFFIRCSGSGVGNVTSYLGWTGCLELGKEEGARGVNMKTGPLWRRGGLE